VAASVADVVQVKLEPQLSTTLSVVSPADKVEKLKKRKNDPHEDQRSLRERNKSDIKSLSPSDQKVLTDKIMRVKRLKLSADCGSAQALEEHLWRGIKEFAADSGYSVGADGKIHLDEMLMKSNVKDLFELKKELSKVPKHIYNKAVTTLGQLQPTK
jgi:hypothetical protein